MPTMRTSIHGRRLGLSSTGGILAGSSGSTEFESIAQMWGNDLIENVILADATISNSGVTVISTGSTSGSSMVVAAPVAGVYKEIVFQTSATALTFQTTAATIHFNSTLAENSTGGSTTLTIAGAAAGTAGVLIMRGLSTTQWQIVSSSVSVSS